MSGMNQRAIGRKERFQAEVERQIARYEQECGKVVTYKLSHEQLSQVLSGTKDIDNFKLEEMKNRG